MYPLLFERAFKLSSQYVYIIKRQLCTMWIYVEENCYATVVEEEGAQTIMFGNYKQELYLYPSLEMLKQVISHAEKNKSAKRKLKREASDNDTLPPKRQKSSETDDVPKKLSGYMAKKPKDLKLKIPPRHKIIIDEVEMSVTQRESEIEEKLKRLYTQTIREEINRLMKENCYGCANDRPSQKDHDLCLDTSYSELVEKFFEKAKSNIDNDVVYDMWYKTFEDYNYPP